MADVAPPIRWQVVLPVKHARDAKTRLRPPAGVSRAELARAMARDTMTAVFAELPAGQVVVVTSDDEAHDAAVRLGAQVLDDPGQGLNAAVRAGLEVCGVAVADADPEAQAVGVAVLLGDLPALRPQDLGAALQACARHTQAVVPDRVGTGTVLLTSTAGAIEPAFGAGSAARHARTATVLALDLPRLRQDVDDATDLDRAVALGLGPATSAVLHLPGSSPLSPAAPSPSP